MWEWRKSKNILPSRVFPNITCHVILYNCLFVSIVYFFLLNINCRFYPNCVFIFYFFFSAIVICFNCEKKWLKFHYSESNNKSFSLNKGILTVYSYLDVMIICSSCVLLRAKSVKVRLEFHHSKPNKKRFSQNNEIPTMYFFLFLP